MLYEISRISNFENIEQPLYQSFRLLHVQLFSEKYTAELEAELRRRLQCTLFVAHDSTSNVFGFKLGYELNASEFYSWTGGVAAAARHQGIGTALMTAQHDWCRQQGYRKIQTKSKNKWRDMLILNLKNGFNIIGTYTDQFGEPKIILEKIL